LDPLRDEGDAPPKPPSSPPPDPRRDGFDPAVARLMLSVRKFRQVPDGPPVPVVDKE